MELSKFTLKRYNLGVIRTVSPFSPLLLRRRFGGSSSIRTDISDSLIWGFCTGIVKKQANEPNIASYGPLTSPDTPFASDICSSFGSFDGGRGFFGWGEPMVSSSLLDSISMGLRFNLFFGEGDEVGGLQVEGPGSVSSRSESTNS